MVLPRVTHLDLSKTNCQGVAFDAFAPALLSLNLASSGIKGIDAVHISRLQYLVELNVSATSLSTGAIRNFSKIKTLRHLNLAGINLKGAAFQTLTQLEELILGGVYIWPPDLKNLAQLKNLRLLDLRGMQNPNITRELIDELKKELPDCEIRTYP